MDVLPQAIKALVPGNKYVFLDEISDYRVLGNFVLELINQLLDSFYTGNGSLTKCYEISKILLDIIWEKLNTGHWKDVDISWRLAYSLVSCIKALAECCVPSDNPSDTEHPVTPEMILKTCDMGLLMGAPILDNILAKLAKSVQNEFFPKDVCLSQHKLDERVSNVNVTTYPLDISLEMHRVHPHDVVEDSETVAGSKCGILGDTITAADMDIVEIPVNSKTRKRSSEVENGSCLKFPKCCQIELLSCPSVQTFKSMYMEKKCPVVIEDCMGHWPALSNRKWSVPYIKKIAGYRTVPVEVGSKYTEESWTQKLMTVSEFIDVYIDQIKGSQGIGYLAQHQLFEQIPELRDDIIIPMYCSITDREDDLNDEDIDISAWFGPCGTISPLHFDPKHNLLVQVIGEKYIQLYPEDQTKCLYPHSGRLLSNTSQVDVENPDLEKFPEFPKAHFSECVLRPGQMLYIPPKCWHYVRSLDVSFSVSFWWS
ncbi:lysine-specific demethylase 8-like [Liolophura sinensis]|uniref:lysine-specific demethylase 8-like n=1 Tax=Liolophura sinensis TaxID=3198878 RepID=UPI00315933A3